MAADPMRCEHDRTPASCEACLHADARADPTRAGVTRDELYPVAVPPRVVQDEPQTEVHRPPARKATSKASKTG